MNGEAQGLDVPILPTGYPPDTRNPNALGKGLAGKEAVLLKVLEAEYPVRPGQCEPYIGLTIFQETATSLSEPQWRSYPRRMSAFLVRNHAEPIPLRIPEREICIGWVQTGEGRGELRRTGHVNRPRG